MQKNNKRKVRKAISFSTPSKNQESFFVHFHQFVDGVGWINYGSKYIALDRVMQQSFHFHNHTSVKVIDVEPDVRGNESSRRKSA